VHIAPSDARFKSQIIRLFGIPDNGRTYGHILQMSVFKWGISPEAGKGFERIRTECTVRGDRALVPLSSRF